MTVGYGGDVTLAYTFHEFGETLEIDCPISAEITPDTLQIYYDKLNAYQQESGLTDRALELLTQADTPFSLSRDGISPSCKRHCTDDDGRLPRYHARSRCPCDSGNRILSPRCRYDPRHGPISTCGSRLIIRKAPKTGKPIRFICGFRWMRRLKRTKRCFSIMMCISMRMRTHRLRKPIEKSP